MNLRDDPGTYKSKKLSKYKKILVGDNILEKLDLTENSVLLVKGKGSHRVIEDIQEIQTYLPTLPAGTIAIACPPKLKVETLDEKEMNALGWYRHDSDDVLNSTIMYEDFTVLESGMFELSTCTDPNPFSIASIRDNIPYI